MMKKEVLKSNYIKNILAIFFIGFFFVFLFILYVNAVDESTSQTNPSENKLDKNPGAYDVKNPYSWYIKPALAAGIIKSNPDVFMNGINTLIGGVDDGNSNSYVDRLWQAIIQENSGDVLKIKEEDIQKIFDKITWKSAAETLVKLNDLKKQTDFLNKLKPEQKKAFLKTSLSLKVSDGKTDVDTNAKESLKQVRNLLLANSIKERIEEKMKNQKIAPEKIEKMKSGVKISGLEKIDKIELDDKGYLSINGNKLLNIEKNEEFPSWFRTLNYNSEKLTLGFDSQYTYDSSKFRSVVFNLDSISLIDKDGKINGVNILYGEGGEIKVSKKENMFMYDLTSGNGETAVLVNGAIFSGGNIITDNTGKLIDNSGEHEIWFDVTFGKGDNPIEGATYAYAKINDGEAKITMDSASFEKMQKGVLLKTDTNGKITEINLKGVNGADISVVGTNILVHSIASTNIRVARYSNGNIQLNAGSDLKQYIFEGNIQGYISPDLLEKYNAEVAAAAARAGNNENPGQVKGSGGNLATGPVQAGEAYQGNGESSKQNNPMSSNTQKAQQQLAIQQLAMKIQANGGVTEEVKKKMGDPPQGWRWKSPCEDGVCPITGPRYFLIQENQ